MQYGALDRLVTSGETNLVFNHISSADKKLVIYKTANHESFLRNDPALWRTEVSEFLLK
jgi:esterase/lipase